MKTKAFTLIEAVIVLAIIALLAGLLLPFRHKPTATAEKPDKVILSNTDIGRGEYQGELRTVVHDGHWFVVTCVASGVSVINHPSCPKCPTMKWIAP